MAKGCPGIYQVFKRVFSQALCKYIVYGNQTKAEEIITDHPDLLLCYGRVKDYSDRSIAGTPLGMALGAEDVKYHDDEECMVEMIHKHLHRLPNGKEIIAEQTAEQFPEGWEQKEAERQARDHAALHQVINTIAKPAGTNDDERNHTIDNAIQAFRDYLAAENNGKDQVFQTGKHFNHQLLVEAFVLYIQNYNSLGEYNSQKNNIVWRKVIGTIERYVPAATAQALCTRIGTIVYEKGKLQRELTLHNYHSDKTISYFPLDADADSDSCLGRDFAVDSDYMFGTGRVLASFGGVVCRPVGFAGVGLLKALQILFRTKTSNLQHLCSAHSLSQIAQRAGV